MSVEAPAALTATPRARSAHSSAMLTIGLVALTITSAAAMRAVFSPLQEIAKADLQISDLQVSLVQGVAGAIPIAILAIPLGRMVDRGNRKLLLVALASLWTLGTFLTVFAQDFAALFFARMLAGVGAVSAVPVAISLVADVSTPETRGRSLLLVSLGTMIGGAAAFALGGSLLGVIPAIQTWPFLQDLAPWRGVHLLFALASGLLLLPLIALREPARREVGEAADIAFVPALQAIWRRRALLAPLFIGQVTVIMADTAASIWAAPVLARNYNQQPADFAGWMGLVILLSGLVGSVLGGVAADLGHKKQIRGGILIGAVIAAILSIPGALFPIMPTVLGFALLLALLLTCGAVTGLITATAIAVLVPNEIRGVCLGAFIVIGSIVGFGVAPTLVSVISSALGGEAHIRYALAGATLGMNVIAAIGFVYSARASARSAQAGA